MGRGINAARSAADDRHSDVTELISKLAGHFDAVMGRHARADHGDGILIFGRQLTFDIEDDGRVINLPQQLRIVRIGLGHDVATKIGDAF